MIDVLDEMIRTLLLAKVPQLTDALQIRFEPPGSDWTDYLSDQSAGGDPLLGVNCYPVELRENASLRSNEMLQTERAGMLVREPAPMRVDVHYLVTAWDSAKMSETLEPGIEEQKLLYAVLAALVLATPLNATRIYPPGSVPATVPAAIKDFDLPTRVVPPDGYAKLAEFWGSMGATIRWRPAVYLVVTLPVLLDSEIVGEPVTTELAGYALDDWPVVETRISIGVEVGRGAAATPVPGAWVRLETPGGAHVQEGRADGDGHLVFADVPAGSYVLRARATGLNSPTAQTIQIPSANGGYRVRFP
jgi:hypothetical protein